MGGQRESPVLNLEWQQPQGQRPSNLLCDYVFQIKKSLTFLLFNDLFTELLLPVTAGLFHHNASLLHWNRRILHSHGDGGCAVTKRNGFQNDLEALYRRLLEMGVLVENAVHASVESLVQLDAAKAKTVIRNDTQVDVMETEIEDRAVHLLSMQKPSSQDLRLISSITKVVTDLERIADNATNIAEVALRLEGQKLIKPLVDIPRMAECSVNMLHDALQALIQRDTAMARAVAARDDEVDDIYARLCDELLGLMERHRTPTMMAQCVHLMFVARYLERIGDHSTNICERAVYLVNGKRVRLG